MTIPSLHKRHLFFAVKRSPVVNAFTLVEVLLVISLFAVISLAIFQTFSNGIKIWDYASRFFPEEDVLISLEKITHDLHNTFYFSMFKFKGDADRFQCAANIVTKADLRSKASGTYVQQIGQVKYTFDKTTKQLLRQQAGYGQSIRGKWQSPVVLAKGIEGFNVTYLFKEQKSLVERNTAEGVMPAMVKVEIDYQAGREVRRMTRFVDLPASLSDL